MNEALTINFLRELATNQSACVTGTQVVPMHQASLMEIAQALEAFVTARAGSEYERDMLLCSPILSLKEVASGTEIGS